MQTAESTVLLISQDLTLCSAVRTAIVRSEPYCRIASVASFAAARHTIADLAPDVIVLQESSVAPAMEPAMDQHGALSITLADVVAALAAFAPVVVLGSVLESPLENQTPPARLAALVAAGAADFVPAGEMHYSDAAACVERRLRSARRLTQELADSEASPSRANLYGDENLGEILRHELNNPLTGILGNAELLLAEMRRHNDAQFSAPGFKRLETIAALAVRMRETVRRLSQACDSREQNVRSL